jgi:hypothetical protein
LLYGFAPNLLRTQLFGVFTRKVFETKTFLAAAAVSAQFSLISLTQVAHTRRLTSAFSAGFDVVDAWGSLAFEVVVSVFFVSRKLSNFWCTS